MSQQALMQTRSFLPVNWKAYAALLFAALAGGITPMFIRFAQEEGIPSLTLVALRLILAITILTPIILRYHRNQIQQITRTDILLCGAAGITFAANVVFYFSALEQTSVLIASVLDGTVPLWVAILEVVLLKNYLARRTWVGLLLAITGGIVIAIAGGSGMLLGTNPVLGILFALTGAVAFALYMIIGRTTRQRIGFLPYSWLVFIAALVVTLVALLFTGTSLTGHTPKSYFWVLVVTLTGQFGFHTAYNYAVKYLSPTYMSLVSQLGVVIAVITAMFAFNEIPGWLQVGGSGIILVGITLATLGRRKPEASSPS